MNAPARTLELATPKIIAKSGDGIGWITFNQPEKRNAISMQMWAGVQAAAEEFAAGLINRIVEPAALEETVTDLAQTIARNAPLSIFQSRESIDILAGDPAKWDKARIESLYARCFDSEDYREGRTAFMEKRPPVFKGK